MTDTELGETTDPSEELRSTIETAVEGQEKPASDQAESPPPSEPDAGARVRDGRGRFAPAGEAIAVASETSQKRVENETTSRPPPGYSVATKSMWDSIPEPVKADIAKREQEVNSGMQRYSGLSRFAEEAERNGTSLQNAVADYAGVEQALRRDFVGGIEHICKRMGIDPRALVAKMSSRYGGAQGAAPSQQQAEPIDHDVIVRRATETIRAELEQRDIDAKIETFSQNPQNRFFGNVRQDMAVLVGSGKASNLQEAYEAACWLNPDIRAILIKEQVDGKSKSAAAAVNSARSAAKAVGGSPAPGINPDKASKRRDLSLREEVDASIDAQLAS